MNVAIRRAGQQDAAGIVALLNPIIQAGTYTVMDEPVTVVEQVAFIRTFPQRGVYHVAVAGHKQNVVGIQDVMPFDPGSRVFRHVGVISTFVALTTRRQGIGAALSQATFQVARALGFDKLWATIRADNPGAVAFYLDQGFRIVGTAQRHALVAGKYVDEILAELVFY